MKKPQYYTAQSGFTLFEMFLTISVLGILVLVMLDVMEGEARDVLYEKNADYVHFIMEAAYDATDEIEEFSFLYNAVLAAGGVFEMPILNTVGVNPIGASLQNGGGGIPANSGLVGAANFNQSMPLGSQVSVIYQILDNPADLNDERHIGIYVFGTNRLLDKEVRAAASAIGANSAYISNNSPGGTCLVVGCNRTIRSIFDSWQIDTTPLAGTRLGLDLAGYIPGNIRQGYVGMYRFVNESDLAGDYLYRTPQNNMPELNAMYGDINLNGNNIVGADDVTVVGNYSLNNPVSVFAQGSVFAGSGLNVDGADIRIDGDMEAGALDLAPDYVDTDLNLPARNLIRIQNLVDVIGNLELSTINAQSGDFATVITPNLTGNGMSVQNVDATGSAAGITVGNDTQTQDLTINNVINSDDTRINDELDVTNTILTNDLDVGNNLTVDRDLNTNTSRFNAIDIDRLEQCLSGC